MILLCEVSKAGDQIELMAPGQEPTRVERLRDPGLGNGQFTRDGNDVFCFYHHDGRSWFQCNQESFRVESDVTATLSEIKDGRRHFALLRGDEVIFSRDYQLPTPWPPEQIPFSWPIDEEDEDFYLWVFNVLNTPERRNMYGKRK